MRESQYQIPVTDVLQSGEAEQTPVDLIHQHRQEAELFADAHKTERTPESTEALHAQLRTVESHLDWYRHEALHTPVAETNTIGSRILGLVGIEKKILPTLDVLIDQESLAGGELFQVPSRFWLHPPVTPQTHTRDWYFTFMRDEQEYTLHYQTDDSGVHKIYNGRKYEFTDGEMERFVEAAGAYEQRVVQSVYARQPATFSSK